LYRNAILKRFPKARFAPPFNSIPRASAVAAEARELLSSGVCAEPGLVNPVYLRKSQAEINRDLREAAGQ
jgi:hypothetical protein